jgi:hypothetical protein
VSWPSRGSSSLVDVFIADNDVAETVELVESSIGELLFSERDPNNEGDCEMELPGAPPFILDEVGEVTGRKRIRLIWVETRRDVRPEFPEALFEGCEALVGIASGRDSLVTEFKEEFTVPLSAKIDILEELLSLLSAFGGIPVEGRVARASSSGGPDELRLRVGLPPVPCAGYEGTATAAAFEFWLRPNDCRKNASSNRSENSLKGVVGKALDPSAGGAVEPGPRAAPPAGAARIVVDGLTAEAPYPDGCGDTIIWRRVPATEDTPSGRLARLAPESVPGDVPPSSLAKVS